MFARGTPLIVGDDDLKDRYIADFIKQEEGRISTINPIVRVRFILQYPIQHAIIWPDVPKENAPVAEGAICRLKVYEIADASLILRYGTYEDSLRVALQDALRNARTESEREILTRHMNGVVNACRVLCYYKERDI